MDFFSSAVDILQTLVVAIGAGLAVWGVINLLEGYGNDNPELWLKDRLGLEISPDKSKVVNLEDSILIFSGSS